MIQMADHFEPIIGDGQLWLGRMGNPTGPAVFLVHGAIENSKIFYNEKGKGIAPFLAEAGFDVFLTDLRGKGKSKPSANSGKVNGGQYEVIMEDIPQLINKIKELKGEEAGIHLMAHSWGGVLISSFYARFGSSGFNIRSMVFFASKRKIYVQHFKRWIMVDLMWTGLGSIATWIKGYLPAKKLRMGSDDEPPKFYFDCNRWVYSKRWVDSRDKFDYNKAFRNIKFPPILSLTGIRDHTLGNKICVKKMLDEIGAETFNNIVLSKENGHRQNYGHIDILTHPDAPSDHFQLVLNWLNQHK